MMGEIIKSDKYNHFTAFALCLFFGTLGIHRFYVGRTLSGVVYLFTFGAFGIGASLDLLLLTFGGFKDCEDKYLRGDGGKIATLCALIIVIPLAIAFTIPFLISGNS